MRSACASQILSSPPKKRLFLDYHCRRLLCSTGAWGTEDIRMLKAMVREKTMTNVIARKLKRSVAATYQKAMRLGVTIRARGSKGT